MQAPLNYELEYYLDFKFCNVRSICDERKHGRSELQIYILISCILGYIDSGNEERTLQVYLVKTN